MLKKSLIALAIAAASTSAFAADITNTDYKILSAQGAVGTTSVTVAAGVKVDLAAEYKSDDIITLTFAGAKVAALGTVTVALVQKDMDLELATPTGTADFQPIGTMVLGKINQTDTQVTYRVTSLDFVKAQPTSYTNTTVGAQFTVAGVELNVASILASGSASVTYAAETSTGIKLDQHKNNTTKLYDVKDQFAAKVTGFNGVVDVNEQRLLFTAASANNVAKTEDQVSLGAEQVTYDDGAAVPNVYGYALPAVSTKQNIVIKGNFAFLGEADAKGLIDDTNPNYSIYTDRIEAQYNALGLNTISVTAPDDVVIPHQKFTATIDVSYTTVANAVASKVSVYDGSAGSWTLNGAVVHVPFMPFRDGYAPIVNISNTSNQDGDIEVLVYAADNAWVAPKSYTLSVPAKAQAQTNITTALRNAGIKGDVAFDIIVNAPKDDIEVSALYFNAGDRAVINTVKQN